MQLLESLQLKYDILHPAQLDGFNQNDKETVS